MNRIIVMMMARNAAAVSVALRFSSLLNDLLLNMAMKVRK